MVVEPRICTGTVVVVLVVLVVFVVAGAVVVGVSMGGSTASSSTLRAIGAATPSATTAETTTAARARLNRADPDARVVGGWVPGVTRRVCPEWGGRLHGQIHTPGRWHGKPFVSWFAQFPLL